MSFQIIQSTLLRPGHQPRVPQTMLGPGLKKNNGQFLDIPKFTHAPCAIAW